MRRGEIWVANLNPNRGQEVGKIRPVVVIQDDRLLATALPTVLVLPLTTQVNPEFEPLRITVRAREKLHQNCQIMVEQVRTLDRTRVGEGPLTQLTELEMAAVERALAGVLGLRLA
ncbi:MAG TPA: type II toxin-antitoxin system PemK/MazF family toxin [Thermoanaerobaculia bacterium]|nr:type II toxin-antitoxin system PemK/MazF family toxin [Thermoanaerobaculia bacterium]